MVKEVLAQFLLPLNPFPGPQKPIPGPTGPPLYSLLAARPPHFCFSVCENGAVLTATLWGGWFSTPLGNLVWNKNGWRWRLNWGRRGQKKTLLRNPIVPSMQNALYFGIKVVIAFVLVNLCCGFLIISRHREVGFRLKYIFFPTSLPDLSEPVRTPQQP